MRHGALVSWCCIALASSLMAMAQGSSHCEISEDIAEVWDYFASCVVGDEIDEIEHDLYEEDKIASTFIELRGPAYTGARFLGNSIGGKEQEVIGKMMLKCLERVRARYGYSKCQMENIIKSLEFSPNNLAENLARKRRLNSRFLHQLHKVAPCLFGLPRRRVHCRVAEHRYRTLDGTCNNLKHPEWGSALRPFARYLEPDYGDGIGSPRRAKNGDELPSAREVSLVIHSLPEGAQPDDFLTNMHMTFGQFLDHDIDRGAISKLAMQGEIGDMMKLVDVQCGEDGCNTTGMEHENCFPIRIPPHDPDFEKPCLQFVRSQCVARHECKVGPREQLNQITSMLDLSQVYGSTQAESDLVRDTSDKSRGRLKTVLNPHHPNFKPLLPPKEFKDCEGTTDTIHCFAAGDSRVNEQIGLMTIHTLYQRAHNNIEEELHYLNPHWTGERLYQEARNILIAGWQFIVYREYLLPMLGPAEMHKYGLQVEPYGGFVDDYQKEANPDITNVFATSAFRFAHSQIQNTMLMTDQSYRAKLDMEYSTVLNRPEIVFDGPPVDMPVSGPDCIVLGMSCQRSKIPDGSFSRAMQRNLFSEDPPHKPGSDLAALDIQRGRDHGIPGYNAWREFCDLPVARDFDDLIDIPPGFRDKFKSLYGHIDDLELFPAAMVERHVPLGVVGPTFACILGQEFNKLRVGDRFWFERPEEAGRFAFSEAQLNEIRKMTFARLLCDNTDKIETIQKYVMMVPLEEAAKSPRIRTLDNFYELTQMFYGDDNRRVPCSQLPKMDLRLWQERRPSFPPPRRWNSFFDNFPFFH